MQDIHVDKRLLAVSKLPLMCQPLFSDGVASYIASFPATQMQDTELRYS